MKKHAIFLSFVLAFSAHAASHDHIGETRLENCIIQEVMPGKNMTGAFARFIHKGAPTQMLRADVKGLSHRVELHSMKMENGVMEMIPLTNPTIEAGERIFKKGADHVMIFDIQENPKVGSYYTMRVFFSNGRVASCQALVKSVADVMKEANIHHSEHKH